jgi:enoyl-CoA hydratase/carnithine racemase
MAPGVPPAAEATVLVDIDAEAGVATLTLNRPDALNALTVPMKRELLAAFRRVERERAVRAVILTGAGRAFCAGQDLRERLQPDAAPLGVEVRERYNPIIRAMRALSKPIVGAINGVAAGAGASLAMACDLRIASASARFCTQFIKLGLGGCDIGVSYTLPRIVGSGQAFDLILTARTVEADEALRIGLVSRLSDDSVLDDALAIAETLCGYGKFGVESTKQVLWANLEAPSLEAALHVENRSQILASMSGELKEATAAFATRKKA